MSFNTGRMIEKLKERIRSGIIFMGGAYANHYVSERFLRKYAKEYAELATGLGGAILLDMLGGQARLGSYEPYISDLADAASDYGFLQLFHDKVVKAPRCWFKDTNTIHCINFDADTLTDGTNIYVTVYVDGASASVASVSGTPADFDVALASPVAEGWHRLVVEAGNTKKDAFSAKKVYAKA